jgi:hypothetical protein
MNERDALREHNLNAVREFMSLAGPDRHRGRQALARPDAQLFARMGDEEPPAAYDFAEWAQASSEQFPNYGPAEYELYVTDDPHRFIARCVGRGARRLADGTEVPVVFPFFYAFLMEGGKIRVFEENRDELIGLYGETGIDYSLPDGHGPRDIPGHP